MRLALIFLPLLAAVAHASTFAACVDTSAVTNGLLGTVLNVVGTLLTISTSAQCATYCTTQGNSYSYFQPGVLGVLATCYCTNVSPPGNYLDTGTNAAGTCASTSYTSAVLNIPQTFNGCYGSGLTALTPGISTTVSSQYQCFTTCANYPVTITKPSSTTGLWSCICANSYSGGTTGNGLACGENVNELYIQSIASVTGGTRKRDLPLIDARTEAEFVKQQDARYCPSGLSACALPGGAWECIDTMTELESCGGCISPYNATTVASGQDCTAIQGATLGGVTCAKGECVVTSCRSGWDLRGGSCVRARGTAGARGLDGPQRLDGASRR